MRRSAIIAALGSMIITVAGCGSSGPSGQHASDSAVRAAFNTYAAAKTPTQACEAMSAAFRQYLSNGNANISVCARKFRTAVGPLLSAGNDQPKITKISYTETQAEVQATIGNQVSNYFFVQQGKDWRLNSIGTLRAGGPIQRTSSAG